MLDAIYIPDPDINENKHSEISHSINNKKITFSIYEFKLFSAQQIAECRHSLFCPECLQIAYFRKASKDGKQACFGSRYHLPDCSELSKTTKKVPEQLIERSNDLYDERNDELDGKRSVKVDPAEEYIEHKAIKIINSVENTDEGFFIDFSVPSKKIITKNSDIKDSERDIINKVKSNKRSIDLASKVIERDNSNQSIKQTLPKLLKSLLNNSSLASSNVWVHTSEKHKWRAKNLFVHFSDAQVLENNAPRMYWGTINNADKELLWLNAADAKNIAIPIKLFQQAFLEQYSINKNSDLVGANIILFAKCLSNKDQSRQFLQLWSNDLQYLHLSLVPR